MVYDMMTTLLLSKIPLLQMHLLTHCSFHVEPYISLVVSSRLQITPKPNSPTVQQGTSRGTPQGPSWSKSGKHLPCVLNFITPTPLSRQHAGGAKAIKMHSPFTTVPMTTESRLNYDSRWIPPVY